MSPHTAAERPLTGDLPSEKDPHSFGFDMSSVSLVEDFRSRTKGDVFSPNDASRKFCVVTKRVCPLFGFEASLSLSSPRGGGFQQWRSDISRAGCH